MKTFQMLALLVACALLPSDSLFCGELSTEFLSGEFGAENPGENCIGCDCPCCSERASGEQQKPWSLFGNCRCLNEHGIKISGYIQQSVTTDSRNPTNPAPTFGTWPGGGLLYLNDEYLFNRLYVTLDRPTDTGGCGWDVGGKVDILYGTDYAFLQARGLETRGDLSPKWNPGTGTGFGGVGRMGLALPSFYAEVAYNELKVKLGRFYHPSGFVGFDPVKGALGNTNTFTLIYNGILPVTGMLAEANMTDQLSLGGGFHRGSQNWEDNNNDLSGFGFFAWKFRDGRSSLKYAFDIGPEDDAGVQQKYFQSIVLDWKLSERWNYILQSNYRHVQNGAPRGGDDNFYSLIHRLAYSFNEKLLFGVRYEWFDDTNGTAVFPAPGGSAGIWHGLSFGGTYKVCPNIWLRPQIRWDWFDADPGVGPGPWGDSTERSHFLGSFSLFTFF